MVWSSLFPRPHQGAWNQKKWFWNPNKKSLSQPHLRIFGGQLDNSWQLSKLSTLKTPVMSKVSGFLSLQSWYSILTERFNDASFLSIRAAARDSLQYQPMQNSDWKPFPLAKQKWRNLHFWDPFGLFCANWSEITTPQKIEYVSMQLQEKHKGFYTRLAAPLQKTPEKKNEN